MQNLYIKNPKNNFGKMYLFSFEKVNWDMKQIILIIITLVLGWIIGTWTSGIEDAIWLTVNDIIPKCDDLNEEYQKLCRTTNQAYYTGKLIFGIAGFIGTVGSVLTILKKIGLFDWKKID